MSSSVCERPETSLMERLDSEENSPPSAQHIVSGQCACAKGPTVALTVLLLLVCIFATVNISTMKTR